MITLHTAGMWLQYENIVWINVRSYELLDVKINFKTLIYNEDSRCLAKK